MFVTIAICTWNRHKLLEQTLEHVTKLFIPHELDWEVVVVNNNSTDTTGDVLQSYLKRLPLRPFFEPNPGVSNARNCAVRGARGAYIVWTDDDTLLPENWLVEYYAAFKRWPDAAVFGGPIEPSLEIQPPQWLEQVWSRVSLAYGANEHGNEYIPLSETIYPYGANYAIRYKEQIQFPYDPRIGVGPNRTIVGEETEVMKAILASGGKGWWLPYARVKHVVPAHELGINHLRSYYSGQGEHCGIRMPDNEEPKLFGRPRRLWRLAIEAELKYRCRKHICNPEVWIADLLNSSFFWGQLRGYALRSRD